MHKYLFDISALLGQRYKTLLLVFRDAFVYNIFKLHKLSSLFWFLWLKYGRTFSITHCFEICIQFGNLLKFNNIEMIRMDQCSINMYYTMEGFWAKYYFVSSGRCYFDFAAFLLFHTYSFVSSFSKYVNGSFLSFLILDI